MDALCVGRGSDRRELPDSQRGSWSAEERDAELRRYWDVTQDLEARGRLFEQAIIDGFPRQQWLETQYHGFQDALEWHKRTLATVDEELQWHKRTLAAAEEALAWHRRQAGEPTLSDEPGRPGPG